MSEHLMLYDPHQHFFERWPGLLYTRCAVSGVDKAGAAQEIVFFVKWQPVLAYVLPIEDVLWGSKSVPDPMPEAQPFALATLEAARAAGADGLQGPRVRMYDGYYYDPAGYVVRTYQQDRAEALVQCPNLEALTTNRPPAALATV